MRKPLVVIGLPALLCVIAGATGLSGLLAGAARLSPIGEAFAASGGSVIGTVRFLETPPKPERFRVDKDNNICGLSKLSAAFVVSPQTKGLKNVVLTMVGLPAASAPAAPSQPLPSLRQNTCVYEPRVQTAVVGQKLQITNHDGVLHNIHAYAANQDTLFNVAQPLKNMSFGMTLEREGVVTVKCDVHSWMLAYIVVASHPYIALTDENGSYRIDGIPPGSYKLQAWHEALGTLNKDLTIAQGRDTTINFDVGR